MVQNGYSVYVEGSATKDATTKSFTWGFKTSTLYDKCKGEVSGKETEGVVVTNGGNDAVEPTIDGDHLFYDDLQSAEAKMRVDNIANADADNDGKVTLEDSPRSTSPTRRRSPPAPTARAAPPTSTTSARSSRRSRVRSATSAAKGVPRAGEVSPGLRVRPAPTPCAEPRATSRKRRVCSERAARLSSTI